MAIDQDLTEHALRGLTGRLTGVRVTGVWWTDAAASTLGVTEDLDGVMERLGSAHDGLDELRPKAICARMSG